MANAVDSLKNKIAKMEPKEAAEEIRAARLKLTEEIAEKRAIVKEMSALLLEVEPYEEPANKRPSFGVVSKAE